MITSESEERITSQSRPLRQRTLPPPDTPRIKELPLRSCLRSAIIIFLLITFLPVVDTILVKKISCTRKGINTARLSVVRVRKVSIFRTPNGITVVQRPSTCWNFQHAELTKMLSRRGKQRFRIVIKLFFGIRRMHKGNYGEHHSLISSLNHREIPSFPFSAVPYHRERSPKSYCWSSAASASW